MALALFLMLMVACTDSVGHPSPTASPSPSKLASGGVIEYPVPNPSPAGSGCCGPSLSGMAAGPDGNVWFFDAGKSMVGRVTPAGSIQQFAVPGTGVGSEAIVAGLDGNIWMVGRAATNRSDWILKVSPAGVISTFPLADGIGPEGITWGPDGNVWFTEFQTGRIGRMTPAGAVTEFPIPAADSVPRGIATGPDHNLWFVESAAHRAAIARMTIAGEVTEYPLVETSSDQVQPFNIVTGPDGNLWFSEIGRIGRITTAGEITQFATGPSAPAGLAGGADGNLWFTDQNANAVGRISPTGVIRKFPLPTRNAGPTAIAAGSDGRMWFTEASVKRIASIGVTVPETTLSARVLNFGSGSTSAVRTVRVTNTGDGPLHVVAATVAGLDQALFSVTTDTCLGHIVAVQSQCSLDVAFNPDAAGGLAAALLRLVDNASGSPHFVSLLARLPECRLPVFAASPANGQFLSLASGHVMDDPNGVFVAEGTQFRSQTSPVLYGQFPASYDGAAGRWVPAAANSISADGSQYAYLDYTVPFNSNLHIVDVATGRDRTLPLPTGPWSLLAFGNDGIYLHAAYEGFGPGAMVVDPDSGASRTVFADSIIHLVAGHVAWTVARNDADTLPQPSGIGGSYNEVESRDLTTSQTTTWLYRPGSDLYVIGAASGSIVVSGRDSADTSYVWVVGSPGQAVPITVPGSGEVVATVGSPIADANGWWLGSLDGVYLWTPRTGAVLVSGVLAIPAGPCA